MLTAEEAFLEQLLSICQRASKFSDITGCGPFIYEFTDKFGRSPLLIQARSDLNMNGQQDSAPVMSALKEVIDKMWPVYDAIIEIIEQKKVILPNQIYNPIIFKNRTEITLNAFDAQYSMFDSIVTCFFESNDYELLEFLKKYAHIEYNNEKRPVGAVFQIDKSRLDNERINFARLIITREWHKFNILIDFHTIYDKRALLEKTEALKKAGQFTSYNSLISLSNALDKAIDPRIDPRLRPQNFVPGVYIDCMYSLYYYAKSKLLLKCHQPIKKSPHTSRKKIFKLHWDGQNMILTINGKTIEHTFIAEKGPVLLLNFISKKWDSLKNIDLKGIYNIATNSSETSLDGDQETTARAHLRELNDIFTSGEEKHPKILNLSNKVATPNLCYKFE